MITTGRIEAVQPARVRYIKLGRAGEWEQGCLHDGVNRIGFGTNRPEVFRLCQKGEWDALLELFVAEGRGASTARRFTNEIRFFFEDPGSILWITFIKEWLHWGFSVPGEPKPTEDLNGVVRPMNGGWRRTDLMGEPLTKDRLSGALTKLAMYRGTSCDAGDVSDYTVRRINGQKLPEVEEAISAKNLLEASALNLMRLLEPRDFEILVDLVFSSSGWRRLGVVGGTEKTRDLDLVLPSTGERAFVQVKSRTTQAQLEAYIADIGDGPYTRMFYVTHTGQLSTEDERVTIIDPERLAKMVIDAGLISWLIHKVS